MRPVPTVLPHQSLPLFVKQETRFQHLSSHAVYIGIHHSIIPIKDDLLNVPAPVRIQGFHCAGHIGLSLEKEPIVLHVNPKGGLGLLESVPDKVHAFAMASFRRPFHVVLDPRKGGAHGGAVLLGGIVIHAEPGIHLAHIRP